MSAIEIMKKYENVNALCEDYTKAHDRDTYVAWVDRWKARYKELSADIRSLKPMRKETRSEYDSDAWWVKESLRDVATMMLQVRHDARAWSVEQREANKEAA